MDDTSYSAFPGGRMFPVGIIALLALVDAITWAAGGTPFWFNVLFTVGLLWGGYWCLWLLISELTRSGELIEWNTPLPSGRVRIVEILRIRPGKWSTNGTEIIEMNSGECLRVMGGTQFRTFCDALHRERPDIPTRHSFQTQLLEGIFRSRRNRPPGP
jgi:hypothetical protein